MPDTLHQLAGSTRNVTGSLLPLSPQLTHRRPPRCDARRIP